MAELAIPIVALGAMYILSNNNNVPVPIESFENNIHVQNNRPPLHVKQTTNNSDAVIMNNEKSTLFSPPGDTQPYFGSNITQNTNYSNENILDFHIGMGSQDIQKREQAPLFKPEKNMHWVHGTPNVNDFVQDRMRNNVTSKMNNVKPWDEIKVAPGLNRGYTTDGDGGFNSGMEAREKWMPKTANEMRTLNNQKNTYSGVVLGPKGKNKRPIMGKMEKNRPDRYYENTPDRWFTTTGVSKAQRNRSEIIMKEENREENNVEYFGGTGNEKKGIYQIGNYEESHRNVLDPYTKYLGGVAQPDTGNTSHDYGKSGFVCDPNSRSVNKQPESFGHAKTFVSALTAPIMDLIKPTRKEIVLGKSRNIGNAHGQDKFPVFNPNDTLKTTIKEQTENTKHMLMGGKNLNTGYEKHVHQPVAVQRDTTNVQYFGDSSAPSYLSQPTSYDQYEEANFNPTKEIVSKLDRINSGNMKLTNNYQNITSMPNRKTFTPQQFGSFSKVGAGVGVYGELNGKNTREIHNNRNSSDILSSLQDNPFNRSITE
tara:strand:- start:6336 stop:7952 length:1617 start_codon:yes stop_codon:yes gene_type:complete